MSRISANNLKSTLTVAQKYQKIFCLTNGSILGTLWFLLQKADKNSQCLNDFHRGVGKDHMVSKVFRMSGVIEANHLHSKPNVLNP